MHCLYPSVLGCSFVLCILGTRLLSLLFSYYTSSLVTYHVPIRLPLELTKAKRKFTFSGVARHLASLTPALSCPFNSLMQTVF